MLLDLVSLEAVNATMQGLGLTKTRLERRFMDFAARKAGRDNWTTAGEMARLFTLCQQIKKRASSGVGYGLKDVVAA